MEGDRGDRRKSRQCLLTDTSLERMSIAATSMPLGPSELVADEQSRGRNHFRGSRERRDGRFSVWETTWDGCEKILLRSSSRSSCASAMSCAKPQSSATTPSRFSDRRSSGRSTRRNRSSPCSPVESHTAVCGDSERSGVDTLISSQQQLADKVTIAKLNGAVSEAGLEAGDDEAKLSSNFDVPWANDAVGAEKDSFCIVSENYAEQRAVAGQLDTYAQIVTHQLGELQASFTEQLKTNTTSVKQQLVGLQCGLAQQLEIETKVLGQLLDEQHVQLTQKLGKLHDRLVAVDCSTTNSFCLSSKQIDGVEVDTKKITQQLLDLRAGLLSSAACPPVEPQMRRKRSGVRLRQRRKGDVARRNSSQLDGAGQGKEQLDDDDHGGGSTLDVNRRSLLMAETRRSSRYSDQTLPPEATALLVAVSKSQTAVDGVSEVRIINNEPNQVTTEKRDSASDRDMSVCASKVCAGEVVTGLDLATSESEFSRGATKSICPGLFVDDKVSREADLVCSRPFTVKRHVSFAETLAARRKCRIREAVTTTDDRFLHAVVQSRYFEPIVALLVVLSTIVLATQTNVEAMRPTEETSIVFLVFDVLFALAFAVEVCLRIIVYGFVDFFTGSNFVGNIFDTTMVLASIVDVLLSFIIRGKTVSLDSTGLLRMLRLSKLLRILRMVTLVHDLKMIIYLISASMNSFLWTAILMLTMIFCASIYFTDSVTKMVRAGLHEADDVRSQWGSVGSSALSLFMSVTGGDDWSVFMATVGADDGFGGMFNTVLFSTFVAFMILVTMNLVTGVFVECAQTQIKLDRDREFVVKTRQMFGIALEDGDIEISWEDFEELLDSPEISTFFSQCDFDRAAASGLFRLLDADHSGTLSIDEFVMGCMRLRGEARSVDLVHLSIQIEEALCTGNKQFLMICDKLNQVTRGTDKLGSTGPESPPCMRRL